MAAFSLQIDNFRSSVRVRLGEREDGAYEWFNYWGQRCVSFSRSNFLRRTTNGATYWGTDKDPVPTSIGVVGKCYAELAFYRTCKINGTVIF